jgi:D-alanine-D-alanine ligase
MKMAFAQAGIPVVEYVLVRRHEWERDPDRVVSDILDRLSLPVFVKPANLGSSVGISKAGDSGQLRAAISHAALYDRRILVERAVDGREIEVSVLGNDDPVASLPGEIIPLNDYYDYDAKYLDDKTRFVIPAEISQEQIAEAQRLAIQAFRAIDCSGMARVDFFFERPTGRILVNEINTIPGFTKQSFYPKLWAASGLPFEALVDRLIELAIERHADRARNRIER